MKSILLLSAIIFIFVSRVYSLEAPCTFTAPNGQYYDLSPLSFCDNTGYTVDTSNDGTFVINVCNTVTGCNNGPSVCQDGQYNTGKSSNISFSAYSGGQGVTMHIGGGDNGGCPKNAPRTTVINFICDNSADPPQFSFVNENPTCNYNFNARSKYACPVAKGPQINVCPVHVYLIPHTHDDAGWILTVEGYYKSEVKHILDTVVASLVANPQRRFIYVEQAYFYRWWTDVNTTDAQRNNFMTIYKNGQLEFVIGGWVMQDEACTTYGADIDQMTLGHQFIYNTFGAQPTKGWQIDPFGASSVTPTLNKLSGFDAHVIDRVTYKDSYEQNQRLQFNWFGSPSLGASAEIFTEIMDGGNPAYCDWYFTFDFDKDPVNSGNVASWAQKFYSMVESRAPQIKTNIMMAEWGCDFAFQNATADFHSMDILVNYLQQNEATTGVYVKYATLSDYFTAVKAVPDVTFPTNYGGDFFPLLEGLYWTGYFTSRVELKGWVRRGEAAASVVEPLFAFSKLLKQSVDTTAAYNNIFALRKANGDAQHHDGVSGTSVQDVVDWLQGELQNGTSGGLTTSAQVLSSFISKGQSQQVLSPTAASLLNIANGQIVPVVIYNSQSWPRDDFVSLAVNRNDLTVVSATNTAVPSQINPNYLGNSAGKYNLFFQAMVPAFGFQTYFVVASSTVSEVQNFETTIGADTVLSNGYLSVTLSGSTGLISNVTNVPSSLSVQVAQNLLWYKSLHSGAYAFGPAGPANPVSSQPPITNITTGSLVIEAFQTFQVKGGWAKQNIRLFKSSSPDVGNFIEFEHQLGVLPSAVEVVNSFSTSINNQQVFSTDDNGFEFITREGIWNVPIGGNYYPTVYASYMRDTVSQLTIISERSHGIASLLNGELEIMVHRNPDMGDGFGPGLTDTTVAYPVIRVIIDTPEASTLQVRKQPHLLNFPLVVFAGAATPSVSSWTSKYAPSGQFISGSLPANVRLLSFYSFDATSTKFILRLTHLFAVGEDPTYSKPATVDVAALFSGFKITNFQESTLTANRVTVNAAPTTVTLTPKQIRTFIITF